MTIQHITVHSNAQVAQSVEQRTENPRVGGSIPPLGTIHKKAPQSGAFLCMGFSRRMRPIDVVRPTAKQLATSASARSPQGTNSPKAVWIIPTQLPYTYSHRE